MDREKLRAEIAKAISRRHGYGEFVTTLPDADAALEAIEQAGFVITPAPENTAESKPDC